jgi:hypothetical protein
MLSAHKANALLLSLGVLCLGLLAIILVLHRRTQLQPRELLDIALADPGVRQAVVDALVENGSGLYDSHPDPEVAYILQPKLPGERFFATSIKTNELGMRERSYAMPKPDKTVRVVLLGDSYVVGMGVEQDERCGVYLEQYLKEHARNDDLAIECLHIGVPSWNILAECSYLRRQLADLRPDLVVHVIVPNDLDDIAGITGFGRRAKFSPQHRDRASCIVSREYPRYLGFSQQNCLLYGLDHESRQRYAEARNAISNLAQELARSGCTYLLILNWMKLLPIGWDQFSPAVAESQIVMLPFLLTADKTYYVSQFDRHWNPQAHALVAKMLYHLIRERDLLPGLSLEAWSPAEEAAQFLQSQSRREIEEGRQNEELHHPDLPTEVVLTDLTEKMARSILGGIPDMKQLTLVGPYASFVLGRGEERRLLVEGTFLPDQSLQGAAVKIFCEEVLMKTLTVEPGAAFRIDEPIPEPLVEHPYLNVRLVTDDYVYLSQDLRSTVSLRIYRLAIH